VQAGWRRRCGGRGERRERMQGEGKHPRPGRNAIPWPPKHAALYHGVDSRRHAVAPRVRQFQAAAASLPAAGSHNGGVEDLELAWRHLESLKALFVRHSGEADARALRCLVALCKAVSLSLEDDYCRDKLAAIEDQGAELFTHGGHRRFSADLLRQRILDSLELLESRLYSLAHMAQERAPAAVSSVARFEVHAV
jgi:hypothetical protein